MTKHHLISTSAHMDSSERIMEYENCYKSIYDLKSSFKSINIIETISKNKLQYLENTGLKVFYSPLNNEHKNKGVNWLRHMTNFISNSEIKDSEIIIFITGRYTIVNTNIISLIEENMIKKILNSLQKKTMIFIQASYPREFILFLSLSLKANFWIFKLVRNKWQAARMHRT